MSKKAPAAAQCLIKKRKVTIRGAAPPENSGIARSSRHGSSAASTTAEDPGVKPSVCGGGQRVAKSMLKALL